MGNWLNDLRLEPMTPSISTEGLIFLFIGEIVLKEFIFEGGWSDSAS
jgi:hypothetical protein